MKVPSPFPASSMFACRPPIVATIRSNFPSSLKSPATIAPAPRAPICNRRNDGRREGAVTSVEIYDDLLSRVVGYCNVRLAVAIKITDGKTSEMLEVGIYILSGFELKGGGEGRNSTKGKDTYRSE